MDTQLYRKIKNAYEYVLENIEIAAQSAGREAKSVKLLVVTKGHTVDTVKAVVAAGACSLGENYIEDALPKIEALSGEHIEWHMIGHIQSRKALPVSTHFDWVHSVDRLKIARRLNNFADKLERVIPVLLECNVSQEESKFGFETWDTKHWDKFSENIAPIMELSNVEVRGLMTMPPFDPDPEKSRPYFEKLRLLQDYLKGKFPSTNWSELSMGMSGDYVVAVKEGATIVRVGTAVVGSRSQVERK